MGGHSGTLVGREGLGRGPELRVGRAKKTRADPRWYFPEQSNPDRLHPVCKADQQLQQRSCLKCNGLIKMRLIQFLFSLQVPPPVFQALTPGQIGTCFS